MLIWHGLRCRSWLAVGMLAGSLAPPGGGLAAGPTPVNKLSEYPKIRKDTLQKNSEK